jgi:hypothetical protein
VRANEIPYKLPISIYNRTVKSVYKGHSTEPENVPFTYRLTLYAQLINGENEAAH